MSEDIERLRKDSERFHAMAEGMVEDYWKIRWEMSDGCRCGGCHEYVIRGIDEVVARGDSLAECVDVAMAAQQAESARRG